MIKVMGYGGDVYNAFKRLFGDLLNPTYLSSMVSIETGMRLAAVGCLQDANVGLDSIVDYLLYFMNKR